MTTDEQASAAKTATDSEARRVGRFGAIGVINTLLDFTIFNIMGRLVGLPPIPSNVISTTCAMTFSFFANKHIVFKHKHKQTLKQIVLFVAITGFGVWVLQSVIIKLLIYVWPAPLDLMVRLIRDVGLTGFSDSFYINNAAKVVATVVSLLWNYIMYKKVVFKHVPLQGQDQHTA